MAIAAAVLAIAVSVSAQQSRNGGNNRGLNDADPVGQPPQGQGGPGGQRGRGPGGPGGPGGGGPGGGGPMNPEAAVERLMTLDTNGDGVLTLAEVTDTRLHNLLQRCDTNSDGQVSKSELQSTLSAEAAVSSGGSGPGGGIGDPGMGPPGGGPGGRGGMRSQPGEVLPQFMVDRLQLNDAQRQELVELQKDVDARLEKILTPDQLSMLRQRPQPGGPGRPPGPPPSDNSRPPGNNAGSGRPPVEN